MSYKPAGYTTAATLLIGCFIIGNTAYAINVEPGDYLPQPAGTNLLIGYYDHGHSGESVSSNGTSTTKKTDLDGNLGIFRYVYDNKPGDFPPDRTPGAATVRQS